MAVLSTQDRFGTWADLMRDSRNGVFGAVTKADIRAAVDAIDTWFSDNATTLNTALPQPFRGQATTSQKALLLMYVISKRYLSGV